MAGRGVVVDFSANVARFTSSVDKMSNDLSKFQSNADRTASNIDKSFARLGGNLRNVFGGLTAALGVRELAAMADSFSNIQARLKLATRDANEFALANENIQRIATSSKSPLESTAILYTRISQSLLDVGGTQKQVADTTQALALALRLSGATAFESSSAMLQFSQAIGSGVLRAQEFNAVNEAAPRVMKALADALGVPIGQLRVLSEEGKITRDVLVDALGSQLPQLLKEAETLPNTIGASLTDLSNKLLLTVGELDRLTGASGKAANFLGEAGRVVLETFAVLGANVAFVFKGIYTEITGIGRQLAALGKGDFKGFSAISDAMKADAAKARKELDAFEQQVLNPKKRETPKITADPAAVNRLSQLQLKGDGESVKSAKKAADERARIFKAGLDFETRQAEQFYANRDKALQDSIAFEASQAQDFYTARDRVAKEAQQSLDNLMKEGKNLQFSVDPMARMNAEIERYSELLKAGAIDQKTFDQAVSQSTDNMKKATEDGFGKMSAAAIGFQTNMQRGLGDNLFRALNGDFENIGSAWKSLLTRMIADGLAADLSSKIFGKNGTGGLLSMFGSILGSLGGLGKAAAPKLGSSTFGQNLWPVPKFAAGGDFMGGLRLVGERGPELEATGPSRIFNANQTKDILGGGGKGGITVNYSPVVNIDSRSDRTAIMQDMERVNKRGQAELVDRLERAGRI